MSDSPASPAILAHLRSVAAGAGRAQAAPAAADAWLRQGLARGQLHEVYAADADDGPAAAGFATALVLAAAALPLLWVRTAEDERRSGRLHATGLAELGLSPDALLLVVADDPAGRLRVAADAARCPGLGTVLVESRGAAPEIDLTATRRLQLAAEASGVTVLALRIGAEPVPSAAATRWGIAAAPSRALDADAPGAPAFAVECLRRRGGPQLPPAHVEWNRDARCFAPPPLAGAGLSLAAGGTAALDPPASVRGTG